MNDEQTRLLQELLAVNKEHLALAKQGQEELQQFREAALASQRTAVRKVVAIIFVFLLAVAAFIMLAPRVIRLVPPVQPIPQEFDDEPMELTRI